MKNEHLQMMISFDIFNKDGLTLHLSKIPQKIGSYRTRTVYSVHCIKRGWDCDSKTIKYPIISCLCTDNILLQYVNHRLYIYIYI